ncbi:ABC transporter substrate-binding protein [Sporosarcina sp. NPDC096371]|uniref:ABC transporter substrate-binding protein n=1 Tax=Sporosarcina sp. NPDC096371 TaxID=3364530 RepID=UPI003819A1FC
MKKNKCFGIALALILVLVLSACTAATSETLDTGKEKGTDNGNNVVRTDLNIGIEASPTTLIPNTDPNFIKDMHLKSIFEPLIGRSPDGEMTPLLATEWENIDDLTWKFKLREGVKFHNGEVLTPEAIKYSIDYIMDEKNQSGYRGHFASVKEVRIINEVDFEIITSEPMPTLLVKLADNLLIMEPKHMEEVGDGAAENPIGTGPYEFVEMQRDQSFKMKAFKDYWDGEQEIKEINYRVIPEFSSRLSAFLAGEIDLLNNLPVDSIAKIEGSNEGKIESVSSSRVIYLGLNDKEGSPFTDKKVRQAANYAINTDDLLEYVLNGQGTKMTGPLSMVNEGYTETMEYEHNPEKAQELLKEAGYEPGELKITLETTNGRYPMDAQVAQAISTQLNEAGFDSSVQINEYATHVSRIAKNEVGEMYVSSMGTQFDAIGTMNNLFIPGSTFLLHTPSKEIQQSIIDGSSIMDVAERKAHFDKLQNWAAEEAVMVPLWQQGDVYAINENLEFHPRVDQRYIFTDVKWKK